MKQEKFSRKDIKLIKIQRQASSLEKLELNTQIKKEQ